MTAGLVYRCCDDRRRAELRNPSSTLNGIDFLEVVDLGALPADRQRLLRVHFVTPPGALAVGDADVRIGGGERIRDVEVVPPVSFDGDVLVVRVSQPGDFSTYRLRLATPDGDPLPGLDPLLSAVDFSFKVECPSDFDCLPVCECPPERPDEPEIDYLAKDYESFRQLLLDRMALLAPQWRELNPADLGVTLVELLAYVGDQLSYQQDAIGTEAYLGTAHRRVSARRHALLVDYAMHDGCNARAWVHVAVRAQEPADAVDGIFLQEKTQFLTQLPELPAALIADTPGYDEALAAGPEVFESLHDATLWPEHDEIPFYLWGGDGCCLPAGATRATLAGDYPHLAGGDLLLLEEVRGPRTGDPADADPARRHVVRLTEVTQPLTDRLFPDPSDATKPYPVTEVAWGAEDALPFPLCLSATTDADHGARPIEGVSVARSNVLLVDHGRTTAGEQLGAPTVDPARPGPADGSCARCGGKDLVEPAARFAPRLGERPLTQAGRATRTISVQGRRERPFFDPSGSAASAFSWDLARTLPVLRLVDDGGRIWEPQRDLLSSDAFAPEFVAEIEEDGFATLRFGDGEYGQRPAVGSTFEAAYRVGNGTAGNVGADAIRHAGVPDGILAGKIVGVRNPLPARGGTDPETVEHVRQSAPAAFRTLERAVRPDDYATLAARHPEIQRAQATMRWTGSWRTVFLTVDRTGGRAVDAAFEASLLTHLEQYRMAGHDVEIDGPRFVPLEVGLRVCVEPGYFRSDVAGALVQVLGSRALPDRRRGAFHPDNFTFGQAVHLGPLYAAAQSVAGVAYVEFTTFQRLGRPSRAALEQNELRVGRLEIARLDNDPSFPERGVLRLDVEGGR